MGWTVEQTSHRLVCDALREVLRQTPQAGPGVAGKVDSIRYRACAVLYTLLLDHSLDHRGRCRSCRRSGAVIGPRRRPCRIHLRACYWLLRQPKEALLPWHLADELGLDGVPDGRPPTSMVTPGSCAMIQLTPDRDPATCRGAAVEVPDPEFPAKTPAGRRSSTPDAPGGQPDPSPASE